jgi:hypothetical protein
MYETATGYGLDGRGNYFSLLHVVQTGSEAHPVSYPLVTAGPVPGDKPVGAWRWTLTSI